MSIIKPILGELEHEARATVRVLERVPPEKLEWAPHVKSMSIGKLAWHIATVPARVKQMLEAGVFDVATAGPASAKPGSFVDTFKENMATVRAFL